MIETLLSVPSTLRDYLRSKSGRSFWKSRLSDVSANGVFIGADPVERRLGSGGGTLHLLHQAWLDVPARSRPDLFTWLSDSQRLVIHAGGESRRLPAYAGVGKAFLPLPQIEGLPIARFDQRLIDLQAPTYRRVLTEAGPKSSVLVTSGDVWLDFNPLTIPPVTADIVGIGMRVAAEVAQHFGVYFVDKAAGQTTDLEQPISFFVQKPSPSDIYKQVRSYDFYVDTGMWLLEC